MSNVRVSVIIPTHNRAEKLAETLACLKRQQLDHTEYEVIVVDDGSTPPVVIDEGVGGPTIKLECTEGLERSAARNRGAAIATGQLLIFLDDDMSVEADFVASHLRAHAEWPGALAVGAVDLPAEAMARPFPRFRQRLERRGLPRSRGLTSMRNFCTAQNMSVDRKLLQGLGGFEPTIISSEDQDLALRHTARGGQIVFLPEAKAVHRDDALDIRSYCRRAEWGTFHMIPFCQRYPDWPDNLQRERLNGPLRLAHEPIAQSLRKIVKLGLAFALLTEILFFLASILELVASRCFALDRVYRLLLGIHIFRGYRKGMQLWVIESQQAAALLSGRSPSVGSLTADR